MVGINGHGHTFPADFLAGFRACNAPAVNTHPLRSRLTICICLVAVLAVTIVSTLAIAANRENYERIVWLATLRARAAVIARQRAVISGGWKYKPSTIRPCANLATWAADSAMWTRGPVSLVRASRSRAAGRTCKETQTLTTIRTWLASQQKRLIKTASDGSQSASESSQRYRPDLRTIKKEFSLTSSNKGKKHVLRGMVVTSASPLLVHIHDNRQGRRPLIVCASGLGTMMGYCRWLVADIAAPLGWTTLVFDPSGIAVKAASSGRMENMSVITEERDLERMVRYARSLPWVDPGRLVLAGQSQGGLASLLLISHHPGWVWRLALDYPALNIPAYVHYTFPTQQLIPSRVGVMGFQMGRRYATDVWDLKPWDVASRVTVATLIEQGDKDFAVDPSVSYRLAGTMPSARLVLVPGEQHNFHNYGRVTSAVRLVGFLQGSVESSSH